MKLLKILICVTAITGLLMGCPSSSGSADKASVKKMLKEDPSILADAIKANPVKVMEAMQEASMLAQAEMRKKQQEDEEKAMEKSFDNPLTPLIRADEAFEGNKEAPLVLVEYSDFECPFCARGFQTVNALKKKYGKNLKFVFKHLPLPFHKNAMKAAEYFEAIRMQSPQKAFKFHDELFANQSKVSQGVSYFKKVAKKVGANMARLEKDLKSDKIAKRIKQDQDEAQKFGIQGTPGFVLNGIPVKGAYPVNHFVKIVDKLKAKNKVKLN